MCRVPALDQNACAHWRVVVRRILFARHPGANVRSSGCALNQLIEELLRHGDLRIDWRGSRSLRVLRIVVQDRTARARIAVERDGIRWCGIARDSGAGYDSPRAATCLQEKRGVGVEALRPR